MKKKVFVVALTVSMIGASPAFAWGGWGSQLLAVITVSLP